jgi:hypothetical protein
VKLEVLQIEFANWIHNCNTSFKGDKFDTKSTPNSKDEDKIEYVNDIFSNISSDFLFSFRKKGF